MPMTFSTHLLRRELAFLNGVCRAAIGTFIVEPKKVEIRVQDADAFARTEVPLLDSDGTNFHFFAHLSPLLNLLTRTPDDTVDFQYSPSSLLLNHACGHYTFDAQVAVACRPIPCRRKIQVSSSALAEVLEPLLSRSIGGSGNGAMNGVSVNITRNSISSWWASSHHGIEARVTADVRGKGAFFIPRQYANAVLSLSPLPEDPIFVHPSQERVFFSRFPRELAYQVPAQNMSIPTMNALVSSASLCLIVHQAEALNKSLAEARLMARYAAPLVNPSMTISAATGSNTAKVWGEYGDAVFEDEISATIFAPYQFTAPIRQLRGFCSSGQLHIYSAAKGTILKTGALTCAIAKMIPPEAESGTSEHSEFNTEPSMANGSDEV